MTQYMPSIVRMMRRAVRKDPDDFRSRFMMARALAELGRFREAIEQLDVIVDEWPDYDQGGAQLLRGICCIRLRWYDDAIEAFESAHEFGASLTETHIFIAQAHVALQQFPDAEAILQSVIGHPEFSRNARTEASLIWHEIGAVRFDAGDTDGADGAFFKAARFIPSSPEPYVRRARFYIERGEAERARNVIERGFRIAPEHPDLVVAEAEALIQLGRETEARDLVDASNAAVRNRIRRRPYAYWLLEEE